VSDKPGEHDFELLRRLVLPDGFVQAVGRLEQVLDFPELFNAYPELRNLSADIIIGGDAPIGALSLAGDNLSVEAPSEDMALSVLLHEVQHAIQFIEGFSIGASYPDPLTETQREQIFTEWKQLLAGRFGSVERGLDPRDWQRGVPLEWLRATGDAQALRVVKAAEDREARDG
jgi:hypothetical protein